jgi:hypothetical protein
MHLIHNLIERGEEDIVALVVVLVAVQRLRNRG